MAGLWRKREKGVWQSGPWARKMAVTVIRARGLTVKGMTLHGGRAAEDRATEKGPRVCVCRGATRDR